jgi:hypothetical protein
MFINEENEKVFQTLPGQGWQVLVDWNADATPRAQDEDDPRYTLEPVVAWVTAKIERKCKSGSEAWEDVVIAPLVRSTFRGELVLLDTRDGCSREVVYLAPGETLQDEHFAQLKGAYRKGVKPRG